jgi:hypothetical protein
MWRITKGIPDNSSGQFGMYQQSHLLTQLPDEEVVLCKATEPVRTVGKELPASALVMVPFGSNELSIVP